MIAVLVRRFGFEAKMSWLKICSAGFIETFFFEDMMLEIAWVLCGEQIQQSNIN